MKTWHLTSGWHLPSIPFKLYQMYWHDKIILRPGTKWRSSSRAIINFKLCQKWRHPDCCLTWLQFTEQTQMRTRSQLLELLLDSNFVKYVGMIKGLYTNNIILTVTWQLKDQIQNEESILYLKFYSYYWLQTSSTKSFCHVYNSDKVLKFWYSHNLRYQVWASFSVWSVNYTRVMWQYWWRHEWNFLYCLQFWQNY